MNQNKLKEKAGLTALEYIKDNINIGIGTGSTVSYFIKALSKIKNKLKKVVSSSFDTTIKLNKIGIYPVDLNSLDNLDIYIDSADEINYEMQMIKGGGGALTHEKIIAASASKFICIADITKLVDNLGKFPLPVEIIPMSISFVSKKIKLLGGYPVYRKNILTDNRNYILDIYNLNISNAIDLENEINNIEGVVTVGLFARRRADIAIISDINENKILYRK